MALRVHTEHSGVVEFHDAEFDILEGGELAVTTSTSVRPRVTRVLAAGEWQSVTVTDSTTREPTSAQLDVVAEAIEGAFALRAERLGLAPPDSLDHAAERRLNAEELRIVWKAATDG